MVYRTLERGLFIVGALMVSAWLALTLHGSLSARLALWAFDRSQAAETGHSSSPELEQIEFSFWDARRVKAYKESLASWTTPPLAVLRIERVRLRVPVFEGTSDTILNRGAGWIEGTARPGEPGNVGVAGHRDGFFRGLKDVAVGDRIEIDTGQATQIFSVDEISIVNPDDVHVLYPRSRPSLTLVTCYPFYFVGSAPQRYIVHASVVEAAESVNPETLRSSARIEARSEEEAR